MKIRLCAVQFLIALSLVGVVAPASLSEKKVVPLSKSSSQAAETPSLSSAQASSGALEDLEEALAEGTRLFTEGFQSGEKESLIRAIGKFQKALQLSKRENRRQDESLSLNFLGNIHSALGENEKALEFYEKALLIERELKDLSGEASILNGIAGIYDVLGRRAEAVSYYEKALALERTSNNKLGQARTLNNLGLTYNSLGKSQKALQLHNQSLLISRELEDKALEAGALNNLGIAYTSLGNKRKALEFHYLSLPLIQAMNDAEWEAVSLNNIGMLHSDLGNMQEALLSLKQALKITEALGHTPSESIVLNNIGGIYHQLGETSKALSYYQRSLSLIKRMGDLSNEAIVLNNIGRIYSTSEEKARALDYYSQSLALSQDIGNRQTEATVLNNIALVHYALADNNLALHYFSLSLSLLREIGDRASEATVLHNVGRTYQKLSREEDALQYYELSLFLSRESGERAGEAHILDSIASLLIEKQPTAAITLYKQSVNVYEVIRGNINQLPQETQEAYSHSVASTYRSLADALISQGRIGEAQQVLELLKIQEINDITEGTRSATPTAQIALSQLEQEIIAKYNSLINFGQKLADCEQTRCDNLSQYQTQYIALTKAYDRFLEDTKTNLTAARTSEIDTGTKTFLANADRIVTAQPNTALIYPLVLENKVRILWATKGGALNQAECPIGEAELSGLVETFRTALQTTSTATPVQQAGKKLYDCLIPPKLQTVLDNSSIDNLIFVPDRITNYIPMAALHDGQQYLIERYSLSNILAASFTDTQDRLPAQPSILGFGLSQAVTLTDPTRTYSALPFVPQELDAIVKRNDANDKRGIFPGQELLDQDFTQDRLTTALLDKPNILHIATHGAFVPTDPRSSYLVLGDGTSMPISDVQYLRNLSNIHLVVLSACETALGGRDRNGLEIAGISSYFLGDPSKAKAVLASLWKVNDPATSLLMSDFYQQLNQTGPEGRKLTKAQAMQAVQLEFIRSQQTLEDVGERAGIRVVGAPQNRPQSLSHPYYWAPFVLIGNSL